jgi:thymidylate synthase
MDKGYPVMNAQDNTCVTDRPLKILVVQQGGRGENKIKGIRRYGKDQFEISAISIDQSLPPVVDDTSDYLPSTISADLVLDFLKHPDLSHDLALLCRRLGIPIVASGKKTTVDGAHTPPVCCALARHPELGCYSRHFGTPEFEVAVKDGKIARVTVRRGAPCGATWEAARRIEGCSVEEAPVRIGLDTQFFCTADPSNWDPLWGKSPVHLAADLHRAALVAALKGTGKK